MKTKTAIALVLSILVSGIFALAGSAHAKALAPEEKTFMKEAASSGLMQVELGKVAEKKAQAPDIKKFAARMVKDHGKANYKLKALARKKGVSLPSRLSIKDKAEYEAMQVLPGANFDKQYMTLMVKDHARDVSEFKTASKTMKDPDLKNWIDSTLPVLEKHLSTAKDIAKKMGIDFNKAEEEGRSEAGE